MTEEQFGTLIALKAKWEQAQDKYRQARLLTEGFKECEGHSELYNGWRLNLRMVCQEAVKALVDINEADAEKTEAEAKQAYMNALAGYTETSPEA